MKKVVITISELYLDRIEWVAESLREEGLTITHLYEFGVIIGYALEENIVQMRHQEGILSLSEEKEPNVPPSDEEIQ